MRSVTAEINHDGIFDKLSEYNASLLKKCARLYKKNILVAENERVKSIELLAKDPDLADFDEIFLRDFENTDDYTLNSESFEDHLEKLCIVNHLFRRDIELFIRCGHSDSLFQQLWLGKFKDETNIEERFF